VADRISVRSAINAAKDSMVLCPARDEGGRTTLNTSSMRANIFYTL
jgi:hypothetical protein